MKRSKCSEEQIVYALRQAENGIPIGNVCRQLGIAEQTFHAWKKLRVASGLPSPPPAQLTRAPGPEQVSGTTSGYPDGRSRDLLWLRVVSERDQRQGYAHSACPLYPKQADSYTCPRCGYEMPRNEAYILTERDFLLAVRRAGVYCPWCLKQLFPESQALAPGNPREG